MSSSGLLTALGSRAHAIKPLPVSREIARRGLSEYVIQSVLYFHSDSDGDPTSAVPAVLAGIPLTQVTTRPRPNDVYLQQQEAV